MLEKLKEELVQLHLELPKNNLVACCKECNTKKKNFLPIEWEEYMNQIKN